MPQRCSPFLVVTTVTPVAKWPRIRRCDWESKAKEGYLVVLGRASRVTIRITFAGGRGKRHQANIEPVALFATV
jgi:hypothetical protein